MHRTKKLKPLYLPAGQTPGLLRGCLQFGAIVALWTTYLQGKEPVVIFRWYYRGKRDLGKLHGELHVRYTEIPCTLFENG